MRKGALLVDLDGTLVDTREANYRAYAAALAEQEVRVTRGDFNAVAQGRNWRQFLPELLARAGSQADPSKVAKRKADLYPSFCGVMPVNNALVRLLEISQSSNHIALVTTASSSNARAVITHHRLGSLFEVVVTGDDVGRHKPDPEAYILAAYRLKVDPADCVVFEDSDIGVAAALAFGGKVLRIQINLEHLNPAVDPG